MAQPELPKNLSPDDKKFFLNLSGARVAFISVFEQYPNGDTRVQLLLDNEIDPFCKTLSVEVLPSSNLPSHAFFVKHWAENEEVINAMIAQGVIVEFNTPSASKGLNNIVKAYCFA